MKRRALALCVGLLLLCLTPGLTLAILVPSNLDQSNNVGPAQANDGGHTFAQTFTVGKTGLLSGIDLFLGSGGVVNVGIKAVDGSGLPTGSELATGTATAPSIAGWVHFSLLVPLGVTSGQQYAIVFVDGGPPYAYGSDNGTDTYPAGVAYWLNSSTWTALGLSPTLPSDLAFRTFVDSATATLAWDKTQVPAGASTPLTLTATMTFANGVEADHYGAALLAGLPTWWSPSGLTCSDTANQIVPADCTIANFKSGFGSLIPAFASGDILTFTLAGTAAPAPADVGTPGVATGEACLNYPPAPGVLPQAPALDPGCAVGAASVGVGAAAATAPPATAPPATPPPTSTVVASASDGSSGTIWLLPLGLVALFGGLLILATRQRRRIS
jgi:hypothetical protein